MSALALRPYQARLVEEASDIIAAGTRSLVMQLPTGGGKTATASEILRRSVALGHRALFCAHLDALIEDTHERLIACGIHAGYIQAGRPSDPLARVQVCSIQTLHRRGERPPADLIIVDECHRAVAVTVRGVLDAYPHAVILGLTATPQRGDGKALGDVFERLVSGPTMRELTAEGHLVPCDVVAPPDVAEKGLVTDPVDAYQKWTPGSRCMVFCSTVEHARLVTERFRARGVTAEMVVGETSREVRRSVRARMTSGELRAIVGVGVFLEGFDLPAVETIILARGFTVCGAFLQAIGRGLRPSPATGKTRCVVLDLRGAVNLHGLPDEDRRWSLEGKAVVRTEAIVALRRCAACLAIFRPTKACPRCGVVAVAATKVPRNLNRAEKLQKLEGLTQEQKDARVLRQLFGVATFRLRMPKGRAVYWADARFRERFGRAPTKAVGA